MPGMMTMQPSAPEGTALGANTTSGAAGIALGNRVVMRGYADFIYGYTTKSIKPDDKTTVQDSDTSDFSTAADVDFLFDFSPITAELHFNATNSNKVSGTTKDSFGNDLNTTGSSGGVGLEQAFARYSFNRDFHITFGRQLTSLGFDDDEAPGLYLSLIHI